MSHIDKEQSVQPATARVRVKRLPDRARYQREVIEAILDEALICHVGFVVDGQPYVIPTTHAREGDRLYFHGSTASRMLRSLRGGIPACVTASVVDGLVLARSAFHHSVNYRSVVVLGRASPVEDETEKLRALRILAEHVVPGRWEEVREPSPSELRQTMVLAMALQEASAKVRSGPPKEEEADLALPIWAGVVPLRLVAGKPETDPQVPPGVPVPSYATSYQRPVEVNRGAIR
jgi:nitroimidazol reductase NimA-like FMN-containing flavoprotein (pyridoxamine 5'-phosphate oxidase superfamily)